jgi:hypothetical protein
MSENSNSSDNSKSGSWFGGLVDLVLVLLVAFACCNKCVHLVLDDTELANNAEFTQLVFVDGSEDSIDGSHICPAIKSKKGGFLSEHTEILYTISGADSCAVISDAFDAISNGKYLYSGKLITDNPFVPITTLSNLKGGETLNISLVEDGYTRIYTRNATVYNKFHVVPRSENQSFANWMDSCRVAGLKDVDDPYISAVFISEGKVERGIFIGNYTPSKYEPEEYIAKLNKDAYRERNNTLLQINDVEITYHCEGTAANVKVTFESLADTLICSFIYHAINEYNWARTDNNTRYGYKSTTIVPGQTKYEFNITPEVICNDLDSYEKIADLALVGVEEGDDLCIRPFPLIYRMGEAQWRRNREFALRLLGSSPNGTLTDLSESKAESIMDYDHRSSFWQKITLRPDLCAAWWKLLIAVALAILSIIGYLYVDDNYSEGRKRTILTAIAIVMLILTIAYAVLWFVLAFF